MSRAVITWTGGRKTIEGANAADRRVKDELELLAEIGAKNVSVEFQDSFDIGRYIDDEEVYD